MKTDPKLLIRKAEEKDIPIILTLIKELAEYEKLSGEVKADEKILKNSLFGNKAYAEVLIAEYNGKIAGQAIYFYNFSTFLGKPGIYLEDLFVRPALRGNGIGKALLMHLIRLAKEQDCGRVEWAVLDWNEPAINFYKNLSAAAMDEWTIFRITSDKFDEALGKAD
jgi:GNAT superfamily N-acetyltransferase